MWVTLAMCFLAQAGMEVQDLYEPSILVLRDGRSFEVRGDIEYLGDEVHFTDHRGERMVMARSLVDEETTELKTNEKRKAMAEGREAAIENDGSLYAQVTQYQAQRKNSGQVVLEDTKQLESDPVVTDKQENKGLPDFLSDQEDMVQQAESFKQEVEAALAGNERLLNILVACLILLAIFALVHLITLIWLMKIAFTEVGLGWGFFLLMMFFAPFIVVFVAPGWPSLATQLAAFLAYPVFIALHCTGRKLWFFCMWGAVYVWSVIVGVGAGIMMSMAG
ncbi:MAG: hypothetical protein KDC35_04820 [Acidobacteria bacterium]|nr:hypothetical protein [Acidobacteriota bacterium]